MIAQCPNCKTRYKVDETKIENEISVVCKNCKNRFVIRKESSDISEAKPENNTKKCPFCAEIIKSDAKKCRFCGEWIRESHEKIDGIDNIAVDKSKLKEFSFSISLNEDGKVYKKQESVYAQNREEAKSIISKKYRDCEIEESYANRVHEIQEKIQKRKSKYSCLKCASGNTQCKRNFGCVFIVLIFVSFGLALFMIPFLPHHCECLDCGFKWKT